MDLSIVVTNWNKSDLIPIQLRFINIALKECNRHMDKKTIEVIIVDHDSDDKDLLIQKGAWAKKYKNLNISIYETWKNNTHNSNVPANIGIKRAKGEFMMWLPSDMMPMTGFHRMFDVHNNTKEIFLNTQLISIPSYVYDFNASCRTMGGGSCKTKYFHEIQGFHEWCIGTYCQGPSIMARLVNETAITKSICIDDIYTLHFERQLHPESVRSIPANAQEILIKYAEKAAQMPKANPDGWGELDTLERIL